VQCEFQKYVKMPFLKVNGDFYIKLLTKNGKIAKIKIEDKFIRKSLKKM